MRRFSILIACAAVGGVSTVRAEDIVAARVCAGITQSAARLACYDKAFGTVPAPEARFGDRGQLQPTHQENLPKSVTAIVQSAKPLGHGLYRLSLDNGQVWETRQADWAMDFKSSDTVTISRMVLGGYQISTSSNARSVAAKRIE